MVSLTQRHDLADAIRADPDLQRIQALLDGGTVVGGNALNNDVRDQLLFAIHAKDGKKFNEIGVDLAKRKIGPKSDWCQDDFLVFLLLLGNQIFGHSVSCLQQVIDARRHTPNSLPQKINEVFAALYRQEFAIDGEMAFLKVPFLHLTGDLKIGPSDAEKVLASVSDIDLWNQFSPFLRLLTQKAHDLVLISRMPQVAETSEELIEGFKKHASSLTLRQWWNVLLSLPGKLVVSVVGAALVLGLIVVLFGFGKGLAEKEFKSDRKRPDVISLKSASATPSNLPSGAAIFQTFLQNNPATAGQRVLTVTLTCEPFSAPTPSFVIEVSHPEKAIQDAIAFTQEADTGERPFTVIPIQKDAGRYRLVLPQLDAGAQLVILVNIDIGPKETEDSVKSRFVLRSLQ